MPSAVSRVSHCSPVKRAWERRGCSPSCAAPRPAVGCRCAPAVVTRAPQRRICRSCKRWPHRSSRRAAIRTRARVPMPQGRSWRRARHALSCRAIGGPLERATTGLLRTARWPGQTEEGSSRSCRTEAAGRDQCHDPGPARMAAGARRPTQLLLGRESRAQEPLGRESLPNPRYQTLQPTGAPRSSRSSSPLRSLIYGISEFARAGIGRPAGCSRPTAGSPSRSSKTPRRRRC